MAGGPLMHVTAGISALGDRVQRAVQTTRHAAKHTTQVAAWGRGTIGRRASRTTTPRCCHLHAAGTLQRRPISSPLCVRLVVKVQRLGVPPGLAAAEQILWQINARQRKTDGRLSAGVLN